ncbi:MAG: NDP-sugar synthase [Alphaproteobacteria bacterium]|nr:NDP-sugar synthase [Alphaproteobacteria bacterium]
MHQAFVLAAGLGTRLRPLTEHRPKPLVPVCGVPLLSWSLALCARHGLRDVVVNAHWLAEQVERWAGEREGVRVTVVTEREILGTGGGLRNVADALAERFVVLNGDVLHAVDLEALLGAVVDEGGALALRPDPEEAPRYGVVAADAEHRVVELASVARAEPRGAVDRTTHFTGIHALDRAALELVPEGFACIVRTAYRELVPARRVGAIRYDGPWLDAGDPAAYLDANLLVLRGCPELPIDPHARAAYARDASGRECGVRPDGVRCEGPVWIGRGAELAPGTVLDHSVVGEGARVGPDSVLTQTVVWDGARHEGGAATRSVVYDGGTLHVGRGGG